MARQVLDHIVDIEDRTVSLALIEAKQRLVFEASKGNFIKVISDVDNTVVYEEAWMVECQNVLMSSMSALCMNKIQSVVSSVTEITK